MASHESVNSDTKFSVPDKQALAALAASSAGDIRSAVNALQFACLNSKIPRSILISYQAKESFTLTLFLFLHYLKW